MAVARPPSNLPHLEPRINSLIYTWKSSLEWSCLVVFVFFRNALLNDTVPNLPSSFSSSLSSFFSFFFSIVGRFHVSRIPLGHERSNTHVFPPICGLSRRRSDPRVRGGTNEFEAEKEEYSANGRRGNSRQSSNTRQRQMFALVQRRSRHSSKLNEVGNVYP